MPNCSNCGKEVSKNAKWCPNCGERNPAMSEDEKKTNQKVIAVCVILTSVIVIYMIEYISRYGVEF